MAMAMAGICAVVVVAADVTLGDRDGLKPQKVGVRV